MTADGNEAACSSARRTGCLRFGIRFPLPRPFLVGPVAGGVDHPEDRDDLAVPAPRQRVGDDVAFVNGAPQSGGSVKYWLTIIPAGSVVVIKNVPVTLVGAELPTGAEIISDVDSKREALLARKAELEAALADINNQLAAL